MGNIGFGELVIIMIVALLVFGRRLPEVSRSMGKAVRQFKEGLRDIQDEVEIATDKGDKPSAGPKDPSLPAPVQVPPPAQVGVPPTTLAG